MNHGKRDLQGAEGAPPTDCRGEQHPFENGGVHLQGGMRRNLPAL